MIYEELKKKHFNVHFLFCTVRTTTSHNIHGDAYVACVAVLLTRHFYSCASSPYSFLSHHFSLKRAVGKVSLTFLLRFMNSTLTHLHTIPHTPHIPHTITSHKHHHITQQLQIISEVIPTLPIRQSAATLTLPSINLFIHPPKVLSPPQATIHADINHDPKPISQE